MSIGPDSEAPRSSDDPAFRDAVTFSFGDPVSKLYGLARIGAGGDEASGLAVVYAGSDVAGASAQAGAAADGERVAGLLAGVERPLESWTLGYEGDRASFDLRFEAVSAPAVLEPDAPVAGAGGMEGYEQLCSVSGDVTHGGRTLAVSCLGQRGHAWGAPDWKRIELARTLSAWLGADRAVTLAAVRPAKVRGHDEEAVAAWMIERGEPVQIADPRLSTTYDGEQRQRRAGLELWLSEESAIARRAAGEVLCGTTIELGDVRLESAFLHWRMEGREGIGRYDVLRRAANGGRRKR